MKKYRLILNHLKAQTSLTLIPDLTEKSNLFLLCLKGHVNSFKN